MIRSKAIPLFLALISLSIASQAQTTFTTTSFRLSLDEKGAVVELADIRNDVNYATAETSFLVGVKSDGSENPPGEWNEMVVECLDDEIKVLF